MIKLSRCYISDVCAGENLFDDNLFLTQDMDNPDASTIIISPNGTGKSTWISFVLSPLAPEKKLFVQSVQARAKAEAANRYHRAGKGEKGAKPKPMEEYLVDNRLGISLLEVYYPQSGDGTADMFSGGFEKRTIGCLYYLPTKAGERGEMKRVFFLGRDPGHFDAVVKAFRTQRDQSSASHSGENSTVNQMRQTLSEMGAVIRDRQNEWKSLLIDQEGIDLWCAEQLVQFCRSEGGLSDVVSFPTERSFLGFFLHAVLNTEQATTLHTAISEAMENHREIPQRERERTAAVQLQGLLEEFDTVATQWRAVQADGQRLTRQLGEASYLLIQTQPLAKAEHASAQSQEAANRQAEEQAKQSEKQARADFYATSQEQYRRDAAALERAITDNQTSQYETEQKQKALKGAEFTLRQTQVESQLATARSALRTANAELDPLRERLMEAQGAYHVRLQALYDQTDAELNGVRQQIKYETQQEELTANAIKEAGKQARKAERRASNLQGNIAQAERGQEALPLESGELPEAAACRLARLIEEQKQSIEVLGSEKERFETAQADACTRLGNLRIEQAATCEKLNQVDNSIKVEAEQRKALHANTVLVTHAGDPAFAPHLPELTQKLVETQQRRQVRLSDTQVAIGETELRLEELSNAKTLSEDALVTRLLRWYHQQGIDPARLRSMAGYLDDHFEGDISAISHLMRLDPARFNGLAALDTETIERVAEIEPPAFLLRPVVISQPEGLDQVEAHTTHANQVIEPVDLSVYSSRARQAKITALEAKLDGLSETQDELESELQCLREASSLLAGYKTQYPTAETITRLHSLHDQHTAALARQQEAEQAAQDAIDEAGNALKQLEPKLASAHIAHTDSKSQAQLVEQWLKQYAEDLPQWREAYEMALAQVDQNEAQAEMLRAQLAEITDRLQSARNAVTQATSTLEKFDELRLLVAQPETLPDEAPEQPLDALHQQCEKAQEAMTLAATEAGLNAISQQVATLERAAIEAKTSTRQYEQEHQPDPAQVSAFCSLTSLERQRESSALDTQSRTLAGKEQQLQVDLRDKQDKQGNMALKLRSISAQQSLSDAELAEIAHLKPLLEKANRDGNHHKAEAERLRSHGDRLREKTEGLYQWCEWLQNAATLVENIDATWPTDGKPTYAWPAIGAGSVEGRTESAQALHEQIRQLLRQREALGERQQEARQAVDSKFGIIKRRMENPAIAEPLFDITRTMLQFDPPALASASAELIERLERVISNLNQTIDQADEQISTLVVNLMEHCKEAWEALRAAATIEVPQSVPLYGGKPIIKLISKSALNFSKHGAIYQETLRNWFMETAHSRRLPAVDDGDSDDLGAELLYRLLSVSRRGQTENPSFGIDMLKFDLSGEKYVPIYIDNASGGEGLTAATLLYTLIIAIRQERRRGLSDLKVLSFLICDNPFSKANRASFVQAQVSWCRAMGIQPVFLTGIEDFKAVSLFDTKLALGHRKEPDGRLSSIRISDKHFIPLDVTAHSHQGDAVT